MTTIAPAPMYILVSFYPAPYCAPTTVSVSNAFAVVANLFILGLRRPSRFVQVDDIAVVVALGQRHSMGRREFPGRQ